MAAAAAAAGVGVVGEAGAAAMSATEAAKAAMVELKRIEEEITKVMSTLAVLGAADGSALVGPEGFPRADVDVHAVRIERNALARLRTDRAAAEARVEALLHLVHAENRPDPAGASASPPLATAAAAAPASARPPRSKFALIGDVTPGSPASAAGLRRGDALLLFGDIDATNFDGVASLGAATRQNVGKAVRVMVQRGASTKLLRLVPQEWAGKGYLGCLITPSSE